MGLNLSANFTKNNSKQDLNTASVNKQQEIWSESLYLTHTQLGIIVQSNLLCGVGQSTVIYCLPTSPSPNHLVGVVCVWANDVLTLPSVKHYHDETHCQWQVTEQEGRDERRGKKPRHAGSTSFPITDCTLWLYKTEQVLMWTLPSNKGLGNKSTYKL